MYYPKPTAEESLVYASASAKNGVLPEEAVRRYRLACASKGPEPHNAPHSSGLNRARRRAKNKTG